MNTGAVTTSPSMSTGDGGAVLDMHDQLTGLDVEASLP